MSRIFHQIYWVRERVSEKNELNWNILRENAGEERFHLELWTSNLHRNRKWTIAQLYESTHTETYTHQNWSTCKMESFAKFIPEKTHTFEMRLCVGVVCKRCCWLFFRVFVDTNFTGSSNASALRLGKKTSVIRSDQLSCVQERAEPIRCRTTTITPKRAKSDKNNNNTVQCMLKGHCVLLEQMFQLVSPAFWALFYVHTMQAEMKE